MKLYTEKQQLKVSKQQKKSLNTLRKYNVNISQFIKTAIKEKINRDWKEIYN